ncbi:MAG TPA: hypothetical protein VGF86_13875 [Candidatus Tumulicola sp.]|jgi:hypothetical protein
MTPLRAWAAVALVLALAACSGGNRSGSSNATPSPAATNSIDFPLFDGATVLSARVWHETITSRPGVGDNAVFTQGAGTYDGHDVVAGTQALMPALEAWLGDLSAHPPAGYSTALANETVDAVRAHTRDMGVDFAVFLRSESGKRHGVVVLAVDPDALDAKAGPMIGAIGKFKLLPKSLRDSIDAQTKKQTGFTISEATNPDSPIGAAVGALAQLRDFGGRGVVLIDAVKQ